MAETKMSENHMSSGSEPDLQSTSFPVEPTPLSPLLFVESPAYDPLLDEAMEVNTPAAQEQIPGTEQPTSDPNKDIGHNTEDQEDSDFPELYSHFFDPPEANFQQVIEEHRADVVSSGRSDQSFLTHTTPTSDVPLQGNTPTQTPPLAAEQNGQYAATMDQQFQPDQVNLVDSNQLNAFQFPDQLQTEHNYLTMDTDQQIPYNAMYSDQLLHNFPNNNFSENNHQIAHGVNGNTQFQLQNPLQNPLQMPCSFTRGQWMNNSTFGQASGIPNLEHHNPMLPEPFMPIRPQQFLPYQPDEFPLVPNLYNQQGTGSFLTPTMLSRHLQPNYQQDINQFPTRSSFFGQQDPMSFPFRRDSAYSRFQPMNHRNHLDSIPQPGRTWLHKYNQQSRAFSNYVSLFSGPPNLSSSTRFQSMSSMMNPSPRTSHMYPGQGTFHQIPFMNSLSQQTLGNQTGSSSANNHLGGLGTNYLERRRQRGYFEEQFEIGESSKRGKWVVEENPIPESAKTSQSQENATQNSAGPSSSVNPSLRPTKNAVYDPLFEGIGLPVDPHLRLFGGL